MSPTKHHADTPQHCTPLTANRSVILITKEGVTEISKTELTTDRIGFKAYGLASIPAVWTKPYVVISADTMPDKPALNAALARAGFAAAPEVMVRSSGTGESLATRGSLVSGQCATSKINEKLGALINQIHQRPHGVPGKVHWIVQPMIQPRALGHLSNERRLSRQLRDWVVEAERSANFLPELSRIAIRRWRDSRPRPPQTLRCAYRANYLDRLEDVARWAYTRKNRIHFEWIWDGECVYIVQADECDKVLTGTDPRTLLNTRQEPVRTQALNAFRIAVDSDFKKYGKLANASLYKELGYNMPDFYVLDDQEIFSALANGQTPSETLLRDLSELTKSPLVIRTDGTNIPKDQRQMLPRSDELRSVTEATTWLTSTFAPRLRSDITPSSKPVLIAHHFIPSAASAWCQAYPNERRVRIESLWGIPEGLYWYAYDTFDVDTQVAHITQNTRQPSSPRIREQLRYKGRYIAPNSAGQWTLHRTPNGPDWQRSIKRRQWIETIAWTSRRIAFHVGHPVVVMWFVDIPTSFAKPRILPWYHEASRIDLPNARAAPRKIISSHHASTLRTYEDWKTLKETLNAGTTVSRVLVDPEDPQMVRDPTFAKQLAQLANQHGFAVELCGGILSHAYYLLSSEGCNIDSIDLDDYVTQAEGIQFNKLVRDKIPENIERHGEKAEAIALEKEALIVALKRKLIEEAFEVFDATTSLQLTEELADLKEVVASLASRLEISQAAIEAARRRKARRTGKFDNAVMLLNTELPAITKQTAPDTSDLDFSHPQHIKISRISRPERLPASRDNIHIDRRSRNAWEKEIQFTTELPIYIDQLARW